MDEKTYRSKIDLWLVLMIAAAAVAAMASAVQVFKVAPSASFVAIAVAGVATGLPLWIFMSTRYTLTPSELRVRSGPFRWVVPLSEVHAVRPTRNPLSSPALSLDRLEIRYGRGRSLLISPSDKAAFVQALQSRLGIAD